MDKKLRLILEVSTELSKEKELSKVLYKLMEITKQLLEADRCSIFLHDEKKKELWTIVAHGVKEIRIPDYVGIAGDVYKSGNPLQIKDAYKDSRFNKAIDKKTGYRTKSILAAPLVNKKGDTMGVFQVINKIGEEKFSYEDIELLNHMILYAASLLENVMLYEELKKAHEDVIYRLSNATEFKDPETKNHILRVGLYCAEMAKKLGWSKEKIELIKLASSMHDIGKVGVPDQVLKKPGKLDKEEWKIMKKHTEFGYEVLKDSDSEILQKAAITALEHHEKWNGTGYPSGKKGTEISIEGRMTALADVFDALTSKRHYKEAWSYEEAVKLIKEEKGEHFDPEMVEVFLDIFDRIKEIKEKYREDKE